MSNKGLDETKSRPGQQPMTPPPHLAITHSHKVVSRRTFKEPTLSKVTYPGKSTSTPSPSGAREALLLDQTNK